MKAMSRRAILLLVVLIGLGYYWYQHSDSDSSILPRNSDSISYQNWQAAAFENRIERVKQGLEQGLDINYQNEFGQTIMHYAALDANVEIVKLLLEHNPNLTIREQDGRSILHYACLNNPDGLRKSHTETNQDVVEIVKLLITHGDFINSTSQRSRSLLHCAVENDNLLLAKYFLANGGNKQQKDMWGDTAYHDAVEDNKSVFIALLSERQSKQNYAKDMLYRELEKAIKIGNVAQVQTLIEKGHPLRISKEGTNALGLAITHEQMVIAKYLVPIIKSLNDDSYQRQALFAAAGVNSFDYIGLLNNNGFDLNLTDSYGDSALYQAIFNGNLTVIDYLVEFGAKTNIINRAKQTPVMYAVFTRQVEAVKLLLNDFNAPAEITGSGSAIHTAIGRDVAEVIPLLISHGANTNKINSDRQTALQSAKKQQKYESWFHLLPTLPLDKQGAEWQELLSSPNMSLPQLQQLSSKMVLSYYKQPFDSVKAIFGEPVNSVGSNIPNYRIYDIPFSLQVGNKYYRYLNIHIRNGFVDSMNYRETLTPKRNL